MGRQRKVINAAGREASRLFVEANATWDRGDLRRAFALFTRSADLGEVGSIVDLGYFYDTGLFVKKDKKKALHLYAKAYRLGSASAASNIATIYQELGDTGRMLWWLRRAAALGDLDVLLELGRRYEGGKGVPANPAKAMDCYRRVLESTLATKEDRAVASRRLSGIRRREG